MLWRSLVVAHAIAGLAISSGCSGSAKSLGPGWPAETVPATANPDITRLPAARRTPARAKHVDGALATYKNREYGLSFQYPRNYSLEENDSGDSDLNKPPEEFDTGVALLATVRIPDDAYPNTNFEHGSLQVLVNESVDEEACRELITTGEPTPARRSINTTQGLSFWRSEDSLSANETHTVEREYTGFFGGRCYVFQAAIALRRVGSQEDAEDKPVDAAKILRHLEKIVASVRLENTGSSPESILQAEGPPRL